MSLSKDNLETIVNLLKGLQQRNDAINQIASNLASGTFWRSPDGKIAIDIDETARRQLEDITRGYVSEARAIIRTIDTLMSEEVYPAHGEPVEGA